MKPIPPFPAALGLALFLGLAFPGSVRCFQDLTSAGFDRAAELRAEVDAFLGRGETRQAVAAATELIGLSELPEDQLRLARASLAEADRRIAAGEADSVVRALIIDARHFAADASQAAERGSGLSAQARSFQSYLLLRAGETGLAIETLDGILADHPDDAEALALRGYARFVNEEPSGALTDLDRAIELSPTRIEPRIHRALLLATTDPAAAAAAFDEVAAAGLDDTGLADDVFEGLSNNARLAVDVLTRLAQRRTDDAHAHFLLGRACIAADDPSAALLAYDRALQLAPGDGTIHAYRAEARRRLTDMRGYVEDLGLALDLCASDAPARDWALARLSAAAGWHAGRNEWGAVFAITDTLIVHQPDEPAHHANHALACARLGRIDEAMDIYEQAMLAFEDEGSLANDYGLLMEGLGFQSEAVDAFQIAARLGDIDGQENLAWSRLEDGDIDAASDGFRRVLAVEPDRLRALSGYARTLSERLEPSLR